MPAHQRGPRRRKPVREVHHPPITREPIDTRRYGRQWVAILDRRIIDNDPDLEALCERLEQVGLDEEVVLMKVPPPGIVLA